MAENVTVTASHEALEKFAKSFAVPAELPGKIARWESGICPVAVGQQPQFTAFVTARVNAIAAAAGAPVDGAKPCTPNIEIVFTSAPQDLLDNIRKNNPDYLGYAETSAAKEKLAAVTHPNNARSRPTISKPHGCDAAKCAPLFCPNWHPKYSFRGGSCENA